MKRQRFSTSALQHFGGFLFLVALLFLAACADVPQTTPTPTAGAPTTAPTPTPLVLPTLYPTPTRPDPATPLPTPQPTVTATPAEGVDLTATILTFRYTISRLELDRRVEANAAGRIQIIDETTGLVAERQNARPLADELVAGLSGLELEPLPDDCPACVQFSYELPLAGESGAGWLRDSVLLGSVENFTAGNLGPHFPAGTLLGLRRTADPYYPAHTLAVTSAGEVWRWRATDDIVPEPQPLSDYPALAGQVDTLDTIPLADLERSYQAECLATPLEILYLNPQAGDPEAEEVVAPRETVRVDCPAFAVPAVLLPLYLALDSALSTLLADLEPPPPSELPLDFMLYYEREDESTLLLRLNGEATATDPAGETTTTTLTTAEVISLTTRLADSGALVPGLDFYTDRTTANILVVRGPLQMLELGWADLAPPDLRPLLSELDALLDEMLGIAPEPESDPTSTPEPEE